MTLNKTEEEIVKDICKELKMQEIKTTGTGLKTFLRFYLYFHSFSASFNKDCPQK